MKFDFSNPNKLAINNAIIVVAFMVVLLSAYAFISDHNPLWWFIVVSVPSVFFFTYFLFKFTI